MTSSSGTFDPISVVCIGLYAKAINPIETLFRALSPRTGMADFGILVWPRSGS